MTRCLLTIHALVILIQHVLAGPHESLCLQEIESLCVDAQLFQQHDIMVSYTGEDLDFLAAHAGVDRDEVVRLHTQSDYTIAMLGFQKHFPYLLGLDPHLQCPRRKEPRLRVTPGAVAIGGSQTGIYSQCSPGGWHIIGYTDPAVCLQLQPGDRIRFVAHTDEND